VCKVLAVGFRNTSRQLCVYAWAPYMSSSDLLVGGYMLNMALCACAVRSFVQPSRRCAMPCAPAASHPSVRPLPCPASR
jgi:hypothetical protein